MREMEDDGDFCFLTYCQFLFLPVYQCGSLLFVGRSRYSLYKDISHLFPQWNIVSLSRLANLYISCIFLLIRLNKQCEEFCALGRCCANLSLVKLVLFSLLTRR